jgi:stage II sporulation protein D (peptidoglycan lytic transglycosylase)
MARRISLSRLTTTMALSALVVGACAKRVVSASGGDVVRDGPSAATPPKSPRSRVAVGERVIRVALAADADDPRVAGSAAWRLYERDGTSTLVRGQRNDSWRIQTDGHRMRAIRGDGAVTAWKEPPLIARPDEEGALVSFNEKRYRGNLVFYPGDSGVLVVNWVRMDDYLASVVPLELGRHAASDSAAFQAQAVTARSYAYLKLSEESSRPYDITGGVLDQVYGGADAENPVATRGVESTRGLLLLYAGRVVNAPYHSTCGGATAAAGEVWRTPAEPYLVSVSDRIPGTDRYYCDIAPRFRWTRTFESATLDRALATYLGRYAAVPGGQPGHTQSVAIDRRTESGRVGILSIGTDRGNFILRGNDIRYVLRPPGGEILNSTYFSVETARASDGSVSRLTIRGTGYGHGVGMCQWGAIGRARAGQDFRTILRTYYPGTTVGPLE